MTQNEIIEAIKKERVRQDELHPVVAKDVVPKEFIERIEKSANNQKSINKYLEDVGEITWFDVFEEELFEIFAETDPVKIREEAIQLAALCVRLCENV